MGLSGPIIIVVLVVVLLVIVLVLVVVIVVLVLVVVAAVVVVVVVVVGCWCWCCCCCCALYFSSPHLCVGFLFLVVYFHPLLPRPPPAVPPYTPLTHTPLAHTHTHTHARTHARTHTHTTSPHATYLHCLWQGWHLATSTCTLRGRRGTYDTGLALVARLVPGDAA